MEKVMDGSIRPASGLAESIRWAARWVGLPIVAIAILPVLVILAGDLASVEVTISGESGSLTAVLTFLLAGAAAIIIQSTAEQHPAWWTHLVILVGSGANVSHAMAHGEDGISLISLILLGFAVGGLIADAALQGRGTLQASPPPARRREALATKGMAKLGRGAKSVRQSRT